MLKSMGGNLGSTMTSRLRIKTTMHDRAKIRGHWSAVCFKGDVYDQHKDNYHQICRDEGREQALRMAEQWGMIRWNEDWQNIVVNAGLDYLLDIGLSGGTQITAWYLGLVNGATPTFAAGDTMASHAGWVENQDYDEANRATWTDGGVSGQSVDNSASVAQFTMNASVTIGGAFLTSDNTKGGVTGTLYAEGHFATDRSVIDNDVLEVTATFTSADDGV